MMTRYVTLAALGGLVGGGLIALAITAWPRWLSPINVAWIAYMITTLAMLVYITWRVTSIAKHLGVIESIVLYDQIDPKRMRLVKDS
jgi:LytS/YehU family sensor histidine kinase